MLKTVKAPPPCTSVQMLIGLVPQVLCKSAGACSTCSCMQIQYGILQINQHDTECFKFSIGYEDANPELKSEELNARVQAHVEYAASISMRLGGDEDDVGRSKAWQR